MSSGDIESRSREMDVVPSRDLGDGSMSFKDMFKSILKAYDDERKWWVAVENFMKRKENGDFAAKVDCSSVFWHVQQFCILLVVNPHMQVREKTHTGGRKLRQQAIVQLMVDLLLNMEAITESQGLSYVLDELESYPVSGMEGWI